MAGKKRLFRLEDSAAFFWSCVERAGEDECWRWTARINKNGYGTFMWTENGVRRHTTAHRIAWLLTHGAIPDGFTVDHLCRNRGCVNPRHLEPCAHVVNVRRGRTGEKNRRKTHCPEGHPYTSENTRVSAGGERSCRKCGVIASRKYQMRLVG